MAPDGRFLGPFTYQCNQIFISHATADDAVVKELREALEARGVAVWADSRELSGGEPLRTRVQKAIEQAPQFLVVLSPKKLIGNRFSRPRSY